MFTGLTAALLAACSSASGPGEPSIGEFDGPWASELRELAAAYPSEFAAQVFADSKITELEFAEAQSMVQECFDSQGLHVTWDAYGRETVTFPDETGDDPPDVIGECAFSDGGVTVMYYRMLLNPRNEDQMQLWATCLVDAGVVEPGYTADDLLRAYDTEQLPWVPGDERAGACLSDPLGVIR